MSSELESNIETLKRIRNEKEIAAGLAITEAANASEAYGNYDKKDPVVKSELNKTVDKATRKALLAAIEAEIAGANLQRGYVQLAESKLQTPPPEPTALDQVLNVGRRLGLVESKEQKIRRKKLLENEKEAYTRVVKDLQNMPLEKEKKDQIPNYLNKIDEITRKIFKLDQEIIRAAGGGEENDYKNYKKYLKYKNKYLKLKNNLNI